MNLFRALAGASLLSLAAGLAGCLQSPDYAETPSIDFKSLTLDRVLKTGEVEADSLRFAINFKDGDGDLGLSADDIKEAPYNATTGGHNNRGYAYNFFIQPFKQDASGNFVPFVVPGSMVGEYDGRYPRLDRDSPTAKPLRGELRYKLSLSIDNYAYRAGDVMRFEISILDRALHESNKITTSEITLGK